MERKERKKRKNRAATGIVLLTTMLLVGCVSTQVRHQNNALEYLYPSGVIDAPAESVTLQLPLRVGIAFAPSERADDLGEPVKREMLKRVAAAFEAVPELQDVVLLPTSSLTPKGGYENLAGVARMNGVSIVALASFDQLQFTDQDRWSMFYWTIIGAYWIPADVHETHTLIDVSVFDVESRALLFAGSGSSVLEARSTAVDSARVRREQSELGLEQATDDLIASLQGTLEVFREHARNGTVRGLGTARVQVLDPTQIAQGRPGSGALGLPEAAAGLLLVLAAAAAGCPRSA